MSIKVDRTIIETDISAFCNDTSSAQSTTVVVRGGIASITGASASGVSMDDAAMTVSYVGNPSGCKPLGVLMQDVVNYDLTRQRQNPWRDEVQTGNKVNVAPKCVVVTDWVYPGHTPTPGSKAYVGHSGYFAASNVSTDNTDTTGANKIVGMFVTGKDQDGFAKVRVNLPNFNA